MLALGLVAVLLARAGPVLVDDVLGRDAAGVHGLLIAVITVVAREIVDRHEVESVGLEADLVSEHLADVVLVGLERHRRLGQR